MDNDIPAGAIPAFIDERSPTVADPAKGAVTDDYHPANDLTIKLIRCLEAIRDLKVAWRSVASVLASDVDRRILKVVATPLLSLAGGIRDLHGEFEHSEYGRMDGKSRTLFRQRKQKFDTAIRGADGERVKTVRDKIAAHIDKETILGAESVWGKVDLASYLRFLQLCVHEIEFLIQPNVYAWSRQNDDPNKFCLMGVDGTLVDFAIVDGELDMITAISFTKTPRECVVREVNELLDIVRPIAAKVQLAKRPD